MRPPSLVAGLIRPPIPLGHQLAWFVIPPTLNGRSREPERTLFVISEFERYLACGILAHGFAGVRCASCGDETLVAFSPGVN